jgi:hypothetical protein
MRIVRVGGGGGQLLQDTTVLKLWVPQQACILLVSWETISFSKKTSLHEFGYLVGCYKTVGIEHRLSGGRGLLTQKTVSSKNAVFNRFKKPL